MAKKSGKKSGRRFKAIETPPCFSEPDYADMQYNS